MRKYLATILGVAVGVTVAILVATQAEDDRLGHHATLHGREGGA